MFKVFISMGFAHDFGSGFGLLLMNLKLEKGFLTWIAWMKKVEELKDLECSVRGRFYDLAWSKPVLRAPAVHGVSSLLSRSRSKSFISGVF